MFTRTRRLKRRSSPKDLQPPLAFDPILRSEEEQFEEEFARWGRGTRPEYIAWKWLTQNKRQREGTDFFFQSSRYGGRQVFGGIIVDFWLPFRRMVWRVQGERFHLLDPEDRLRDELARMRLMSEGITVVDLWSQDLEQRPGYVLNLAWEGKEPPSRTKDLV